MFSKLYIDVIIVATFIVAGMMGAMEDSDTKPMFEGNI